MCGVLLPTAYCPLQWVPYLPHIELFMLPCMLPYHTIPYCQISTHRPSQRTNQSTCLFCRSPTNLVVIQVFITLALPSDLPSVLALQKSFQIKTTSQPSPALANALKSASQLLKKYGYSQAGVYGSVQAAINSATKSAHLPPSVAIGGWPSVHVAEDWCVCFHVRAVHVGA